MANSKIIYGDTTLIDLTQDTATSTNDVADGIGKLWENMKKDVTDIKCRVVFKDTGFYGENGDEVKSNSILILKQYGIDNVVTV